MEGAVLLGFFEEGNFFQVYSGYCVGCHDHFAEGVRSEVRGSLQTPLRYGLRFRLRLRDPVHILALDIAAALRRT